MFLLMSLAIVIWVSASALGTQARFRDEEKPSTCSIHESFARLTAMVTGRGTELSRKVAADQTDRSVS